MLSFPQKLPRKIAIVRMLPGLGDFLVIVPALRAIRYALPDASITFIGLEPARQLCRRFNFYITSFEAAPGFPGIPDCAPDLSALPGFLTRMQAADFDLAIQMHGDGSISNIFTDLLKARVTAGYHRAGNYCPHPDRFLVYTEREPEPLRYLRLVQALGFTGRGEELEFPLTREDRKGLSCIEGFRVPDPQTYVCLHPGASDGTKRWPPEYFAALGNELTQQGWQVVLTGTAGETGLCRSVETGMEGRCLNLSGRTRLGELAILLSDAALIVSNDTGISHLAAALDVASVIIFTASDPARWAPLNGDLHRAVFLTEAGEKRSGRARTKSTANLAGARIAPGLRLSVPSVATVLAAMEGLLRPRRRHLA